MVALFADVTRLRLVLVKGTLLYYMFVLVLIALLMIFLKLIHPA